MEKNPKILIVSHNPLSDTQSNGKTITSLLSFCPKESLAQLYFTMDTPDFTICDRFFRISDLDILKNFFMIKKDVGTVITKEYSKKIKGEKEHLHHNFFYSFIRKLFVSKISIMTTLRDYIWKNSEYYSKSFEKWLEEINPDIIFFQSSNCCFAFEFVYEICKKKNIKVIMQTTDDYLSYKKFGLFFNLNVYKLRKCYQKLNQETILILPISKKMELYYQKHFPNQYYVAMNSVVPMEEITFTPFKNNIKILYAGNLGLNRFQVLHLLAKAIDSLNRKDIFIEIYSIEKPNQKVIDQLNFFDCCRYCGSLDKNALLKKRAESDILLHVESFDKKNRHLTQYSISTKIPELMNSNKPILAIGPKEVASIEYLKDCRCAYIIDSNRLEEITKQIKKFLSISNFQEYLVNAHHAVAENHDIKKVQSFVRKVISNYEKKKNTL